MGVRHVGHIQAEVAVSDPGSQALAKARSCKVVLHWIICVHCGVNASLLPAVTVSSWHCPSSRLLL